MFFRFWFFLIGIFSFLFFPLIAEDLGHDSDEGKQEDSDMEALRRWIRDKRMVTVKEIGGDLSLSGEVRVEMQAASEKKAGVQQRGWGGATSVPLTAFDCEVNVMLDYRSDRTWGSIKLEYDNDMGQVGGTTNKIALEKAYLGGRIVDGDTFTFDLEMGRRGLNNVFDSKIEFGSLFDGMLLKFSKASEAVGNFYWNAGALLVNDYFYHFGYVTEMGLLNIRNTGIYTKLSLIDWKKKYSAQRKTDSFKFLISQWIVGYQHEVSKYHKLLKVYMAGLWNSLAKRRKLTRHTKANCGCYFGVSVGEVRKTGDWAIDANYQIVAAQAIPDFDVSGIKRGNAAGIAFNTTGKYGAGVNTTPETCVGSGNYKGWQVEALYAVTGNFTILNNFQKSSSLRKKIGPKMRFFQYEIEFIYAF
ncbi:MAG: hypothetical protein WC371_01365 [Parachlamydiales bacterium]|jgi:hypothetical protein